MKERTLKPQIIRRVSAPVVAIFAAATLVLSSANVAVGAEDVAVTPEAVEASLNTVEAHEQSLIHSPVASGSEDVIDQEISVGSGTVEVSSTAQDGVVLNGTSGRSTTIHLPFADQAGDAVELDSGAIVFPGVDSSSAVIVSHSGIQMLTTIANAGAPTRYSHDVSLEPGQILALADGGVNVLNADNSIALVIPPAWAKDANGVDIPTSYEINGTTLTQVVSHAEAGAAYPVVADPLFIAPWVFRCLLGLGLSGPQIVAAFASGTIWGGLGRAALACVRGK